MTIPERLRALAPFLRREDHEAELLAIAVELERPQVCRACGSVTTSACDICQSPMIAVCAPCTRAIDSLIAERKP